MAVLQMHGSDVLTVFQLLGFKENDITYSLSWALTNCPAFLNLLVYDCVGIQPNHEKCRILIQDFKKETDRRGFTDLEITDNSSFHIIFEAKRGWNIPSYNQLEHYSRHFQNVANRKIISLSECSQKYANKKIERHEINGIPLSHLSWQNIVVLCKKAYTKATSYKEKNILNEFANYMNGVVRMQNQLSNQVFIVSLSSKKANRNDLSYIDIVKKKSKYFYPIKGSWPKNPPNYIAFRYSGKLQSIHHVEDYTITKNIHDEIDEMPDIDWDDDHYILTLGPAIIPSKDIKNGPSINYACRAWALLDTLLTSSTITEAVQISKNRIIADLDNNH